MKKAVLILFVISLVLASCTVPKNLIISDDHNDEPEKTEMHYVQESNTFSPEPGDITIASTLKWRSAAEDYGALTGAKVNWVQIGVTYEDDLAMQKELLEKYPDGNWPEEEGEKMNDRQIELERERLRGAFDDFRSGKVDMLLLTDSCYASLLAMEGSAAPLDDLIGDLVEDEDYFRGVVDAGRVNGTLFSITPFVWMTGVKLPRAAYEKEPGSIAELREIYDTLEPEYRAADTGILNYDRQGVYLQELALLWDVEKGGFSDGDDRWEDIQALWHAIKDDAKKHDMDKMDMDHLFRFPVRFALCNPLDEMTSVHTTVMGDRVPISRYGMEAAYIPYPSDGLGFGIAGETLVVSAKSPHKEACAAFLRWILSPETQGSIASIRAAGPSDFFDYGIMGLPICRSAARTLCEGFVTVQDPKETIYAEWLTNAGMDVPDDETIIQYNLQYLERADHYTFDLEGGIFFDWLLRDDVDYETAKEVFSRVLTELGFEVKNK